MNLCIQICLTLILTRFDGLSSLKHDENELDTWFLDLMGHGVPGHLITDNRTAITVYCNKINDLEAKRAAILADYGHSQLAAHYINHLFDMRRSMTLVCKGWAAGADSINRMSSMKEVGAKNIDWKPARDGITKALLAAGKPDTKLTLNDVYCLLNKWVKATRDIPMTEATKATLKLWLITIQSYVDTYYGKHPEVANMQCDWSQYAEPTPPHHKSIQLLFIKALINLDKSKA